MDGLTQHEPLPNHHHQQLQYKQTLAKFRHSKKDFFTKVGNKGWQVVHGLAGSPSQQDSRPAACPLLWPQDNSSFPCDVLTTLCRYRWVWRPPYESTGNAKKNNAGKLCFFGHPIAPWLAERHSGLVWSVEYQQLCVRDGFITPN